MNSSKKKNKLKYEEDKPMVSKNYFTILKDLEKKKMKFSQKKNHMNQKQH